MNRDEIRGDDRQLRALFDTERRVELLETWRRRQDVGLMAAVVVLAAGLATLVLQAPPPDPAWLAGLALAAALLPLLPLGYPRRRDGRLAARLDRALGSRELLATWIELDQASRRGAVSPFFPLVRADACRVAAVCHGPPAGRHAPTERGRGGTPVPSLRGTIALAILAAALGAVVLPAARAARRDAGQGIPAIPLLLEEALSGLSPAAGNQEAVARARNLIQEALEGHPQDAETIARLERAVQALELAREAHAGSAAGSSTGDGDAATRLRDASTKVRAALRLARREPGGGTSGGDGRGGGAASRPEKTARGAAGGRDNRDATASAGKAMGQDPIEDHDTDAGAVGSGPRATPSSRAGLPPLPPAPEDERIVRAYFAAPRG